MRADDAFDGVGQDEVRELVGGEQRADEGAAVHSEHADFFYGENYISFGARRSWDRGVARVCSSGSTYC